MNRPVEQALLSLLPTLNSALPPQLTDLANSLLAQSRHRATILKADEEIARPYACAHIACDRLKTSLNLPPIKPQPPIPPRIYKRLYTHLDGTLVASTPSRGPGGRIRTPSSKLRASDINGGASPLAQKSRGTPGKDVSLAQLRSVGSNTPSKTSRTLFSKNRPSAEVDQFPAWLRPVLRFLCAEVGPTSIGPVVMSGMESIAAPHGKRTDDVWVNGNLVSLLAAVYMCVWRGVVLYKKEVNAKEYGRGQAKLLQALRRARKEVEVEERKGEDAWEGWQEVKVKDLDTATLRMSRHGWLEMSWVQGIEDMGRVGEEGGDEQVNEKTDDEKEGFNRIWRPDSMVQARYDYVSEQKRRENRVWKEDIMMRLKALENDSVPEGRNEADTMDIE